MKQRWSYPVWVAILLTATLVGAPVAQAADCYVTTTKEVTVTKTRDVYLTYKVPVKVERTTSERVYGVIRYEQQTRSVFTEVTDVEMVDVYDYWYLHTNYWTWGQTQCTGYGQDPNCGSHGEDWLGHETEYFPYVVYSYPVEVVKLLESVITEYVPIYGWKTIEKKYEITEWVTKRSTTPTKEYYTEITKVVVNVPCADNSKIPVKVDDPTVTKPGEGKNPQPATTVTLTYDAGEGVGSIAAVRAQPNSSVILANANSGITRPGFTLAGWKEGNNTYPVSGRYVLRKNTIMTAVWTKSGMERPT